MIHTKKLILDVLKPHQPVQSAIEGLGGSLHSIDEVEVCSETETAETL